MLTLSALVAGFAGILLADQASQRSAAGKAASCRLAASFAAVLMAGSVALVVMGAR